MWTFHGFVDELSALKGVLKDTAGLADYSVTEGQAVGRSFGHNEL
jgi:hypothetical protein